MSGGECPTIIGLKLDQTSISAIKELKEKAKLTQIVGKAISFSLVVDMFFSRNVPTVSVNISQTEWEVFAEAMAGIPKIHRHEVVQVSIKQELRLYKDPKQRAFWRGIRNGCSY